MNPTIHKSILTDLQERAAIKGGACLSKEYIDSYTPLLWRCQKGHTWETISGVIKRGGWCPACARNKRRTTIEELDEIAKKRGGKCLSTEYINRGSKLKWQCKEGHIWYSAAGNIKSGHWCKVCAHEKIAATTRLSLKEMQELAKSKGGLCLSEKYKNSSTPLLWQCKEGHRWKSSPIGVRHRGDWCKKCAGLQKGTIGEMRKLARRHRGECLSEKYISSKKRLTWKCKEGHSWDAVPYSIKNGSWCGVCADKEYGLRKRETQFEKIKLLLKKRGYLCLSKEYVNNNTFLILKCRKGHTWKNIPKTILKGKGLCPECFAKPGPKNRVA